MLGDKTGIGMRIRGRLGWDLMDLDRAAQLWTGTTPQAWQAEWTGYDTELKDLVETQLRLIAARGVRAFARLDLRYASDAFLDVLWTQWGADFMRALAAAHDAQDVVLPCIAEGELKMVPAPQAAAVLPWTAAGFADFVRLAPSAGLPLAELDAVAERWWGRRLPRGVQAQRSTHKRNAA